MATIYIKDLVIAAKHGVHQYEKENAQNFRVSVELDIDTTEAGKSDKLADALDWSKLRDDVVDIVQNNSFNLMEHLAQVIANKTLSYQGVEKVVVSIDKVDAFKTGFPSIRLKVDRSNN